MDERILVWTWDIDNSIKEVDLFFDGQPKIYKEFENNLMLKRAIQRNLEIIGEAMNRILKRDSSMEQYYSDARAIVGLRNQIIHGYDTLSDDRIWAIVINRLPILRSETSAFLEKYGDL